MAMRLLSKSEIAKVKADTQRQTIDEGLKLAKRIDNLREVASQEEESLAKFRKEQVAKIYEEIKEQTSVRDEIRSEIEILTARREELKRPLTEEYEQIKHQRESLKEEYERNRSLETKIDKDRKQAETAIKRASNLLTKAEYRDILTREKLMESINGQREADRLLKGAQKIEEGTRMLDEKMRRELAQRDAECSVREREIKIREDNITESENNLSKEWRLLEDRKKAFERNIMRINKK